MGMSEDTLWGDRNSLKLYCGDRCTLYKPKTIELYTYNV